MTKSATALTLRRTTFDGVVRPDDYGVWWRGRDIGRIHLTTQSVPPQWVWAINIAMAIPPSCRGNSPTLDEAKADFRKAWDKFLPTITEADLQEAWKTEDEAEARAQRQRERSGRLPR